MSTTQKAVVKQARIHCSQELEQRQQEAALAVMEGEYVDTLSGGYYRYPAAAERQHFQCPDMFLAFVGEQAIKGIKIFQHESPVLLPSHYSITYYKPQDELNILITEAKEKATQDYQNEIEQFNQQQVELLAEQLVQTELNKEKKKEEEKLNSIKAKALATATQHIQQQLEGK